MFEQWERDLMLDDMLLDLKAKLAAENAQETTAQQGTTAERQGEAT